jgi:hypothetical protein
VTKTFAIETFISDRCSELVLSHSDLIRGAGYKDVSKGMRRLEQLYAGDVSKGQTLIRALPAVLAVPAETVNKVIEDTQQQLRETENEAWRRLFKPHAIILTEHYRPQTMFVAAFIGVNRLLRIDFDLTAGRTSYIHQALNSVREKLSEWKCRTLPAFGRPTGVVVNYTPDRAVMFSLEGKALEILPRAYRVGKVRLSVCGQRVSPEVLNKIISGARR